MLRLPACGNTPHAGSFFSRSPLTSPKNLNWSSFLCRRTRILASPWPPPGSVRETSLFRAIIPLLPVVFLILAILQAAAQTNLPAFPGALGFGARASGGRGGEVYHVSNLNDRGPGSLREGVDHPGRPRTILFDVGGYISLESILHVGNDVTIAGQTAPGEGLGLRGSEVSFSGSHNVIVRHLRIRQGLARRQDKKSAVAIYKGRDMIFDHVSIQWGRWDTVDMNLSGNITFQDCIIGPGVIPQRFGCLCQCETTSFIRNLWISNQSRNPKAKGTIQYINNVVYNWGGTGFVGGHSGANHYADLINNYFIKGPSSSGPFAGQFSATDLIYQSGNWADLDRNGRLDGRAVLPEDFGREKAPMFLAAPAVIGGPAWVPDSASAACEKILAGAGASLHRDTVDRRLIADLASFGERGQTIRDPEEMGGFGTIAGGQAVADTDGDGLPDGWEIAHGLNPKVADSHQVAASGYTQLEEYLNGFVIQHSSTTSNTPSIPLSPTL